MSAPEPLVKHIAALFESQLDLVVPSADTDLFESGALDSLSFVKLLLHIETDFGIAVSLEELDLDEFRSVAAIAGFVARRTGDRVVDFKARSS